MSDINVVFQKKVAVIGGGAAGLFAAYFASLKGNDVTLFEKNEKLGKKIYITGKGRCNLSNDVDVNEFINNVVNNGKFLFGALNFLSPKDTFDFFESNGTSLKIERGNRVFPKSDKASDVTKTLEKLLNKQKVKLFLNQSVDMILSREGRVYGLVSNGREYLFDSVIVCTGGLSYPLTGSTGDGYAFAKSFGHKIIDCVPSLIGIELLGNDYIDLQGISLKNVSLTAFFNGKKVFNDFGEMLFTHYGISGPIVLSCSCNVNRLDFNKVTFSIDLKPALSKETLDLRLIREFKDDKDKAVFNAVRGLLPKNLVNVVLNRAKVDAKKICSSVTREERSRIISVLKDFTFTMKGLRSFDEAIITSGGVCVSEINPKTMESKLIKGLFFAGEVLDVDCYTGGFNLQTAFSTGALAGENS